MSRTRVLIVNEEQAQVIMDALEIFEPSTQERQQERDEAMAVVVRSGPAAGVMRVVWPEGLPASLVDVAHIIDTAHVAPEGARPVSVRETQRALVCQMVVDALWAAIQQLRVEG